jgi:transposase
MTDTNSTDDYLPDNIPECHRIIKEQRKEINDLKQEVQSLKQEVQSLKQEVADLKQIVEKLNAQVSRRERMLFGRRSEKVTAASLTGTGKVIYEQYLVENPPAPPEKKKNGGGGRTELPPSLTTKTIRHELPLDELPCPYPDCYVLRAAVGFDASHQLEYIPASFKMIVHQRIKYACKVHGEIITADKSLQPIDKGLPGPGLLAQVSVAKYADHSPLYRQQQIYKRLGVNISRSSMCRWLKQIAELVRKLVALMENKIRLGRAIQSDETPLPFIIKGNGKTKRGYMWTYRGDNQYPYVIYDFTENRSAADGPDRFLQGYKGYLQTDGGSSFSPITDSEDVIAVNCMAHARRYFEQAQNNDKEAADHALAIIKILYDIERRGKDFTEEQRYKLRQHETMPRLTAFKSWLDEKQKEVLPKSAIGVAITYCQNRWVELCQYADTGFLNIDNNLSENALRPIVLGRKNWLFGGSSEGGKTAATLASLINTCKRLNIDPFQYMKDVIIRLSQNPDINLEELLPDKWTKTITDTDTS